MRFHVYRHTKGFVVSPDCMQAPVAVLQALPARCNCGEFDLPAEATSQVWRAIMRDGFALIGEGDVATYDALDRLCTSRFPDTNRDIG